MLSIVSTVRWPWARKRRRTFDGPVKPIDQLFAEMQHSTGTTATRRQALSVPAVRRGRNMLCSIATMPLEQVGPDNTVRASPLLAQIDLDVANVVTISQTVEDLVFDGISWWLITAEDLAGFPVAARHLDVSAVSLQPPKDHRTPAPLPSGADPREAVVWVDGEPVGASRIIRFDSPNPAVLQHAGREMRRAILLDKAADMYADDPRPLDYFTPADGADPVDDDEVEEILAKWKSARRRRSTGWIPAAMAYNTVDAPSPQQLQLAELARQATLDIANALGIDPEDLGLSTTSRTYSNDVDRRRNKLNDVLAPYMRAITDRLSMGDVTRRGYRVRFNTTEYLMPNPGERWIIYETAVRMKAMTLDEVRAKEGEPPLPDDPAPTTEAPAPVPDPEEAPVPDAQQVDASRPVTMTFDLHTGLTFVDVPVTEFSVDSDRRIIEGLVLPYNVVAAKGGYRFKFLRGSLQYGEVSRVKLLRDHDMTQPLGKAVKLHDKADGMRARFSVARGPEGDRALELAEDGVLDGLSVGVDFDLAVDATPDPKDQSLYRVHRADWRETSLTPMPSFDTARVTKVAASQTNGGGHVADTPTPETVEPPAAPDPQPATVTLTAEPPATTAAPATVVPGAPAAPADPVAGAPVPVGFTLDQLEGLRQFFNPPAAAVDPVEPPRQIVDPTRPLTLAVTREAVPYRFDRGGNFVTTEHDFSRDLKDMAIANDAFGQSDAGKRVLGLLKARFNTDQADVNELNPDIQRPDMFVDQQDFKYPLWDFVSKGALPGGPTPFVFPKFNSASGLVADHVEGVEPAEGVYTTTSQTVTPTAMSGKANLTREVWDAVGNPAVSTLVFGQMVRSWREALETAAATFLNTLTAATDINLGVATVDDALASAWDLALAGLQFSRGYDFSAFAIERGLYEAFVDAVDSTGRKLYPITAPQNANGTAQSRFRTLDLGGVTGVPSWALPDTVNPDNSWLFDPMFVHGWTDGPMRLEFPGNGATNTYTPVAHISIAIWGYRALANSDIAAVRQVIYDDIAP